MFQSTFPRGERPIPFQSIAVATNVSIHVPARGTTIVMVVRWHRQKCFNPRSREGNDTRGVLQGAGAGVSIHVPARGTTRIFRSACNRVQGFNPRSREGNDGETDIPDQHGGVSIHVPARGTTVKYGQNVRTWSFQSTFPRGERRLRRDDKCLNITVFQSTFPRGERRCRTGHEASKYTVSIHVPARGTTCLVTIS